MARSITEIQTQILDKFSDNPILSQFNSTSSVAIYKLIIYVVAFAIFIHEQIFDLHKAEIDDLILNQKSGRPTWYRTMALKFQYGFDLIEDTDFFDNTGQTQSAIDDSMIVKYAAVNESEESSRLIIKIAGEENEELAPLTLEQRQAFEAYIQEIRYAGVQTTVINYRPDLLFLNLQIQRDPLVLDADGMSIRDGNFPVNEAIQSYMKLLPFDGEFVIFDFLKYIEANAAGVVTPTALNIETSFIDPDTDTYGEPVSVAVRTIPESGYFKVNDFDNISYVV